MAVSHLSINGATKFYKDFKAVDSIDLKVERGKFLTILGPSGSGKTSLLKLIAGFESLSRGQILLNNKDISEKLPHERNIGMVFQNYALFPHMTVEQNIAYPLRIRKIPKSKIREKVRSIMDLVNLTGFSERKPDQLSGGQQQRVALARAIVFNPPLLLLDEPLGALDKNLREKMQIEIRRIQKEVGITTINVTHDQQEALTMSDEICVMNKGKIEQVAPAEDIYTRPLNKFVANFIGEVNLLEGTVEEIINSVAAVRLTKEPEIKVKALAVNGSKIKSVLISIRPENVHLVKEQKSFDNEFLVEIIEKVYLGDSVKLKVKTKFNEEILMKTSNKEAKKLSVGIKTIIGWSAEDATLIRD